MRHSAIHASLGPLMYEIRKNFSLLAFTPCRAASIQNSVNHTNESAGEQVSVCRAATYNASYDDSNSDVSLPPIVSLKMPSRIAVRLCSAAGSQNGYNPATVSACRSVSNSLSIL